MRPRPASNGMRESAKDIKLKAKKRARRVRAGISGTSERPRMSVRVSNRHLYVQCVDDSRGKVLASMSDEKNNKHVTVAMAADLGKRFAELAKSKGIEKIALDRGSRLYHGRVKAFADGAREGGLKF